MHDLVEDPDATSEYECLPCGEIVVDDQRPMVCPSCERTGTFQNRALSLE